jgi:putative aldouronate transport system substrate-binding protein
MLAALAAGGDSADTSGDVAEIGRFGDQLPSHQPLEYATADLAVPPPAAPGFTSYPSDAVRAIENPPGRGGPPIGITTVKWGPIPPGAGRNAYLDTIWRRKP